MSEIESKILDTVKDTLPALDDGKQQFLLGYVEGMAAATGKDATGTEQTA